ncbi:MAG: hypothetical protein MZV63_63470 [Marinilabiliales bacterium]|nr:hypothetical protein [Marinilabiliales bacterium]
MEEPWTRKGQRFFAVILAVVSVVLVMLYTSGVESEYTGSDKMVEILVAKVKIPRRIQASRARCARGQEILQGIRLPTRSHSRERQAEDRPEDHKIRHHAGRARAGQSFQRCRRGIDLFPVPCIVHSTRRTGDHRPGRTESGVAGLIPARRRPGGHHGIVR